MPSRQLLLAIPDGRTRILISTGLPLEYEAVLTRPAMPARFGLADREVIGFLDDLPPAAALAKHPALRQA